MATLVSPGVSVTVTDESFYIPASAPTVPLMFIATQANKFQPNGITVAAGTNEHSIVRGVTAVTDLFSLYGVPVFRQDASGNPQHGDCRNEYGLFALGQFLGVGSLAYVIRANVDLADNDTVTMIAEAPIYSGTGNGTMTGITTQAAAQPEVWTITAIDAVSFAVFGSVSGDMGSCVVGQQFTSPSIQFTILAGPVPFTPGDTFSITVFEQATSNPLGATDAVKRLAIVTALKAEINSNQDIRSEIYEYNLLLCPGYSECVDELLTLSADVNDEAFVIADTPMTMTPDDIQRWAMSTDRFSSSSVAYYYPHGLASNFDGKNIVCAASGIALRVYAYSDNATNLWFAPAGPRRGMVNDTGVTQVGYLTGTLGTATTFNQLNLNQGQRDQLYGGQMAINPIVFFPGRGLLVWGQKTSTVTSSALDRVNVVRLIMYIKRSLRKGSFAYVFEPNDQITRDNLKSSVDGFLGDLVIRRGLYDFASLCDSSNNSADRIDRNEMWLDVALKPVKDVEFIYIPIRVISTGASAQAAVTV